MPRSRKRSTPGPHEENIEIGIRLGEARKRKGLSQAELATAVELSQRTISSYESGLNRIPTPVLLKLVGALRVPVTEIVAPGRDFEKKDKQLLKLVDRLEKLPPRKRRQIEEYVEFIARG